MRTNRQKFFITAVVFCLLICVVTGVHSQETEAPRIPVDADVAIVGGGGMPIEDPAVIEKLENGSVTDDFGAVCSASGDLTITLKDVYITDNLTVITLSFGTERSASNHVSSGAVYINGVQRAGGGNAGEAAGEPFDGTMTFVFYGGIPEAKLGAEWDSLRVSFEGLVLAAYEGTDAGYFGTPEGYKWSYVFHNPEVSRYNDDGSASTMDEAGIHTTGNAVEIKLADFSLDEDRNLSFDLIEKTNRLNLYGSSNSVWINDRHQGGGGNSVSFDAEGNPEAGADEPFIHTAHFLYQQVPNLSQPDSLSVWARSVTFELTQAGTPRSWIGSLAEENYPMNIVRFYNVR